MDNPLQALVERIKLASKQAAEDLKRSGTCQSLRIEGGGTKGFYGEPTEGPVLSTRDYSGVIDYEPSELVVTARCGTPVLELQRLLASHGQMLGFEPPLFGAGATVGGMVASGLSGPRRASAGSVRDFVLGTRLIDAQGQLLQFGGRVMKNVAGYDVSRLLCGSLGILGVIAEVSIKVLPQPLSTETISLQLSEAEALNKMNEWAAKPLPITATAWHDGQLFIRLAGAVNATRAARQQLGGERLSDSAADQWWESLREQTHAFFSSFQRAQRLWRFSLPSTAPSLSQPGTAIRPEPCLIEWNGAQRWMITDAKPEEMQALAKRLGGSAMIFRNGPFVSPAARFAPLDAVTLKIHRQLKQSFDPMGIFNRGRLLPDF